MNRNVKFCIVNPKSQNPHTTFMGPIFRDSNNGQNNLDGLNLNLNSNILSPKGLEDRV